MSIVVTNIATGSIVLTGATCTITVPGGGVPSGVAIYVAVTEFEVSASITVNGTVADNGGGSNTYVEITGGINTPEGDRVQVFQVFNSTALTAGKIITYTLTTSANYAVMTAFYVSGLKTTASPFDSATKASSTFFHAGPTGLASGTPGVAGELFLAVAGWVQGSGLSGGYALDTGNGWTNAPPTTIEAHETQQADYFYGIAVGVQVNAGTGTKTMHPTFSGTASINGAMVIFGLQPFIPPIIGKPLRVYLRR